MPTEKKKQDGEQTAGGTGENLTNLAVNEF